MKKFFLQSIFILVVSILFLNNSIFAQTYKFQKFGTNSGICHNFVYSINQDKHGFLWISTGIGLCRFDGFNFTGNTKDSLPETQSTISFKDKSENLWFGFNDGTIVFYDGNNFKIIKADSKFASTINDITEDHEGNVIVASQNSGILVINKNFEKKPIIEPFKGKLIYTLALNSDNRLLIGTDNGIELYNYDSDPQKVKFLSLISGIPPTKINTIHKTLVGDNYWIGTDDAGILKIKKTTKDNYTLENLGILLQLQNENVQSVFEDENSILWISTKGKGLFKVILNKTDNISIRDYINYNSANGLDQDLIKSTFKDREGNIWVATYGNGLAALINESFIYYDFKNIIKGNNIQAVCYDKDGYWIGGNNTIIHIKTGLNKTNEIYSQSSGLPSGDVTALYLDKSETLWIGTLKSGVFQLLKGAKKITAFLHPDNSLGNSINSITGFNDIVYISTKNGIFKINSVTHKQEHFSTSEGIPPLPYNNIHQTFVDSKGNDWVATRSNNVFALNNELTYNPKGGGEIDFTAITQDSYGTIWAGTNGNGIFQFLKDTMNYFIRRQGLKSDYCYTLNADKSGNIWVGHQQGLSRINVKTHQIKIFGSEYISGDINFNASSQDSSGNILFGTTDGLVLFESTKNKKSASAPIPNITSIIINDKEYSINNKITLPYSSYRLKIEFIGLNYSNPEQVIYQYKLDGFDPDWSETTKNRTAIYSRLTNGNYKFLLKACNGDGVCVEMPFTFELEIRKPFWATWWFFTIAILILVGSVYYIIKSRERKQKEFQIYLEKLLDERTREVREQKEEIESKNRDITDSINYAQRIQASILPSLRKLQHIFTGSFVYYAPRDIVSGDFYWFEVIPDTSKFLVVCADSTGHGVPGAFMSIIGTTLLKDIYTRQDVQKPSDILHLLDRELKSTLNQNTEGERPSDGMDIIVCEIDIKTYQARFASAMRPFIVYQNGEQLYFKGSRSSIGGQAKEAKIFEDIDLQLTKGDLIYMFSDGYPDQFGGPMGKKFKMVRLRNLLKDIHQKPMEEQYNYVKSNFDLWKDELEQVDDVLFMGIKI